MKKLFLIVILIVLSLTQVYTQKLHIETKSQTDEYHLFDLDSIEIVRLEVDAPVIYSITPNFGESGDTVVISGKNFLEQDTLSTTYVLFGNTELQEISWSETSITIQIPENAVTSDIKVIVRNKESNAVEFKIVEHTEAPEILYINPSSAEYGDTISIQGRYFGSEKSKLLFGSLRFEQILSWSDTLIIAVVPDSLESGMIYVERDDIRSNAYYFEIIKLPVVTRYFSVQGFYGDTVRIWGRHFGENRFVSQVWFGTRDVAEYLSWSDTLIVVKVPIGAESGDITLRIVDQTIRVGYYHVIDRVFITSLSPISVWPGDELRIKGINFDNERYSSKVTFNGVKAEEYVSWSDKNIKVIVPDLSGIVEVKVTANEVPSNILTLEILSRETVCGKCIDSEGKEYKTIKIGEQCWMAENLNIGTQIFKGEAPDNNEIIEKYCYNDSIENCDKWGGLYSLEEALSWDTTSIGRGICPDGWRISTDDDWKVLEDEIESQGFEVGSSLVENGESGFQGLFAGFYHIREKNYAQANLWATFCSPTIFNNDLIRKIRAIDKKMLWFREYDNDPYQSSFSLRCIKSPKPVIDSVFPTKISVDETLTIFGKFFGNDKNAGVLYLKYETRKLTDIVSWTDTEIRVKVSEGLFSGLLHLEVNGQIADNKPFINLKPKLLFSIPQSIDPGDYTHKMRIFGTGWRAYGYQDMKVFFGTTEAELEYAFVDSLWSELPYGVPTTNIYLQVDDSVYSNPIPFKINKFCGACVDADGRNYRTIQVGTQCWMGENLSVGRRLHKDSSFKNNNIIEKRCNKNVADSCDERGGMYIWNEAMNWTEEEGNRGICPSGWHLPKDDDWKTLERHIGMSETDIEKMDYYHRGNMLLFFSLYLDGYSGMFMHERDAYWTSSTAPPNAGLTLRYFRYLIYQETPEGYDHGFIRWRQTDDKLMFIRCVKD